jgi:hydroxyethylthiazole kinase-like uncharacterized protein yjeF
LIHRVLPSTASSPRWALHGVAASRQIEQDAAASLPPHTLMRRAGQAVAQLALAVAPHARRIWVAAGPGNNGGDGLDAALHLHAAGKLVHVTLLGDASRLPPDAADALARAQAAGVAISTTWPPMELDAQDLAIDALLGLGARRTPTGQLAEAIERLNASAAKMLAVDLPTGLDAETGWLDEPDSLRRCVRADHTLSLLTLKPGLFTAHGRDQAGTVWYCDLGVDPNASAAPAHREDAWLMGAPGATQRRHAQHKGSFGSVVVVGGATGMSGAALLAGRAALHAGAGRVYAQLLDANAPLSVDLAAPELMLRREMDWHGAAVADYTVVAGCGGGQAIRTVLPLLLSRAPRLVLDADALNALATDSALQTLLVQRAARQWHTVLTPHPLEAARLLGVGAADVQSNRVAQARELAHRLRAIVVLKGSGTIVQAPDGPASINPTGNADLGSAGTGDVLAGWIGGLWAQGADALPAACHAVYLHGLRADEWRQPQPQPRLTAGALAASASA